MFSEWGVANWSGMPLHVQVVLSLVIGGLSGVVSLLKSDEANLRDWLPQFISSSVWGFIGFSMTPLLHVEPVISKIGIAAITGWLGSDTLSFIRFIINKGGGNGSITNHNTNGGRDQANLRDRDANIKRMRAVVVLMLFYKKLYMEVANGCT